ncbi:MAG: hypothetical protein CR966_00725 [Pseudomonadales bacterium]|nr:MAG: hypothetical protein CR966_00725 [Pseudomonadales bacterium]
MGIDCWVSHHSPLQEISLQENSLKDSELQKDNVHKILITSKNTHTGGTELAKITTMPLVSSIPLLSTNESSPALIQTLVQTDDKNLSIESKIPATTASTEKTANIQVNSDKLTNQLANPIESVAPFTLQGVQYGNWVLLIDEGNLSESAGQLWQKICQALSLNIERLQFPIYEGMTSVKFANATLEGFIFKLSKQKERKFGRLTALTEGLDDTGMTELPLLEEMTADPTTKRKFWQLINS